MVLEKLFHPNLKLLIVTEGSKGCRYYTKVRKRFLFYLMLGFASGNIFFFFFLKALHWKLDSLNPVSIIISRLFFFSNELLMMDFCC